MDAGPRALPRGGGVGDDGLCHQRGVGPADARTRLCGGGEGGMGGGGGVGHTIYGSDELPTSLQTQQQPYALALARKPSAWVARPAPPLGFVSPRLPYHTPGPL